MSFVETNIETEDFFMSKKEIRKRVTSISAVKKGSVRTGVIPHWKQAMEDFLFWKKSQGLSETTLKGYSNHICHFFNRFEIGLVMRSR